MRRESLFLSGPMGAGKSTVGRLVAEAFSVPFLDLDEEIVRRSGRSVEEIFQRDGEMGFRRLERQCLRSLLDLQGQRVVALGGGAVLDKVLRHRMIETGVLITLQADTSTLEQRVRGRVDLRGRPLLNGDSVEEQLTRVIAERRAVYAECHGSVDTSSPLQNVVNRVSALWRRAPVAVPLGERSYCVYVDETSIGDADVRLNHFEGGSRVMVVTDRGAERWGRAVMSSLGERWTANLAVLPSGEQHKNLSSVEHLWESALAAGFTRDDWVVAAGGGVVGDLAGFAASTVLRGVRFAQVPTTVLSMVDSSVGGKTGFDTDAGKNLVGSFYQPRFVLCDLDTLATLPREEFISGFAEVIKSAWLSGEAAVTGLEERAHSLLARDRDSVGWAVRMGVQLKSSIVTRDEYESGARQLLNLGHTLGHAMEAHGGYGTLRHGEAVALGMAMAFDVEATLRNDVDPRTQGERCRRLLSDMGLPVDYTQVWHRDAFRFVTMDKKRKGDSVTFILPGCPGNSTLEKVPLEELKHVVDGLVSGTAHS